jgi:CheY-like chemotaxis protein
MDSRFCPSCHDTVPLKPSERLTFHLLSCGQCGLGLDITPVFGGLDSTQRVAVIEAEVPDPEKTVAVEFIPEDYPELKAHEEVSSDSVPGTLEAIIIGDSVSGVIVDDESLVGEGDESSISLTADTSLSDLESSPADADDSVEPRLDKDPAVPKNKTPIFVTSTSQSMIEALVKGLGDAPLARGLQSNLSGADTIEGITRHLLDGEQPRLVLTQFDLADMTGMELCFAVRAIETACKVKKPTPILIFGNAEVRASIENDLADLPQIKFIPRKPGADSANEAKKMVVIIQRLIQAAAKKK